MVIVSAINKQSEKHILAVLPDRKKETVKAFLEAIPAVIKATIQQVCVDMYEGYSNAVYEALPGVAVIVDRFHVAKNYRGCADKARKQEMKALKKILSDEDYAELKGVMWLFRKSWASFNQRATGNTVDAIRLFANSEASLYFQRRIDFNF